VADGQDSDFFTAVGNSDGTVTFGFATSSTSIAAGARLGGNDVGVIGHVDKESGPEQVGVRGEGLHRNAGREADPPGTGILGRGGMCDPKQNTKRVQQGAGVVGVAGAFPPPTLSRRDIPGHKETGNVGVFGLGGNGERFANLLGGELRSGARVAGPGVLGHGGKYQNDLGGTPEQDELDGDGAGVAGISGGLGVPPPEDMGEMLGAGVFGRGLKAGVVGVAGFKGGSPVGFGGVEGRGGIFRAKRSAQVQLEPRPAPTVNNRVDVVPDAFFPADAPGGSVDEPAKLPRDGQAGDLLATTDFEAGEELRCTLWFCTSGQTGTDPAVWREVLLGPPFAGTVSNG
jgi:hypothetical protein